MTHVHSDYRATRDDDSTLVIRCANRDCDAELGVWEHVDGRIALWFNDDALDSDIDVETCSWCTRLVLDSALTEEHDGSRTCVLCHDPAEYARLGDLMSPDVSHLSGLATF